MTRNRNELVELVTRHPFAWPGGYEMAIITDDGGVICQKCVGECRDEMLNADPGDGWYAVGYTHTGNEDELRCDHCYRDLMGDE